jgi:hypothetical protein
MATLKHMAVNGDRYIKEAIKALKAAIKAGHKIDEMDTLDGCNWRMAAAEIEKCLDVLTSKPPKQVAAEIWGTPDAPGDIAPKRVKRQPAKRQPAGRR